MKKVGIITQARTGSSRLPNKIFKTVNGIPLIKYHYDRLKKVNASIIIATTTEEADNQVEKFCIQENILYHRGSEFNVLERFYETASKYKLDVIVRITSDCPLIDLKLIEDGLKQFEAKNSNNLYISNSLERTFPRGFDYEIFSFKLLEQAYKNATSLPEKEHVTVYMREGAEEKGFQTKSIKRSVDKSEYRITVDTAEDFELVSKLIANHKAHLLSADEIIGILDSHPELVEINKHIEQKKIK